MSYKSIFSLILVLFSLSTPLCGMNANHGQSLTGCKRVRPGDVAAPSGDEPFAIRQRTQGDGHDAFSIASPVIVDLTKFDRSTNYFDRYKNMTNVQYCRVLFFSEESYAHPDAITGFKNLLHCWSNSHVQTTLKRLEIENCTIMKNRNAFFPFDCSLLYNFPGLMRLKVTLCSDSKPISFEIFHSLRELCLNVVTTRQDGSHWFGIKELKRLMMHPKLEGLVVQGVRIRGSLCLRRTSNLERLTLICMAFYGRNWGANFLGDMKQHYPNLRELTIDSWRIGELTKDELDRIRATYPDFAALKINFRVNPLSDWITMPAIKMIREQHYCLEGDEGVDLGDDGWFVPDLSEISAQFIDAD